MRWVSLTSFIFVRRYRISSYHYITVDRKYRNLIGQEFVGIEFSLFYVPPSSSSSSSSFSDEWPSGLSCLTLGLYYCGVSVVVVYIDKGHDRVDFQKLGR